MFKSRSIKFKRQAKTNGEHALVNICMAELCKKAGFADSKNMVQRDLIYLCERIGSQTGVIISLSTIKRLLNGQFSRLPQIATLDAIAVTAGYQNWQDFKLTKKTVSVRKETRHGENTLTPNKGNFLFNARAYAWTALFLVAAILFLAVMTTGNSGVGNN